MRSGRSSQIRLDQNSSDQVRSGQVNQLGQIRTVGVG